MLDKIALTLVIIGAIVWGCIGLFGLDIVAFMFGAGTWISRLIYILVGIAGLWAISFYFKRDDRHSEVE